MFTGVEGGLAGWGVRRLDVRSYRAFRSNEAVSRPERVWFRMFAAVGVAAGVCAAAVFWLILTRPLLVVQAILGVP